MLPANAPMVDEDAMLDDIFAQVQASGADVIDMRDDYRANKDPVSYTHLSPFPAGNQGLFCIGNVSTRYKDRDASLSLIHICSCKGSSSCQGQSAAVIGMVTHLLNFLAQGYKISVSYTHLKNSFRSILARSSSAL